MAQRDLRIDNIRFILILLVVFGHLIEPMRAQAASGFLYTVIYAFHMPAFVFLSGYFARFSWRRIGVLVLIYALFQTLYQLVGWLLAGGVPQDFALDYLTPDWVMWYLLALIVWTLLVPLLKTGSSARRMVVLAVSVIVALVVGFIPGVGYFLSLSRIFCFAPFFIAGVSVRQWTESGKRMPTKLREDALRRILLGVGITGALATCVVVALGAVEPAALYNSMPYGKTGSSAAMRLVMMVLAACWICLLFAAVPARRVAAVTSAGAHTLPIYLLHGLIVRIGRACVEVSWSEASCIAVAVLIAFGMCLALGNRVCERVVRLGL